MAGNCCVDRFVWGVYEHEWYCTSVSTCYSQWNFYCSFLISFLWVFFFYTSSFSLSYLLHTFILHIFLHVHSTLQHKFFFFLCAFYIFRFSFRIPFLTNYIAWWIKHKKKPPRLLIPTLTYWVDTAVCLRLVCCE